MKISIQTKLLVLCIFLVLITAISVSIMYYTITKQDTQRETRERMAIAFDIILNELTGLQNAFTEKLRGFLETDATFRGRIYMLEAQLERQERSPLLASYVEKVADELKKFGRITSVNRLAVYSSGSDLLAVYQNVEGSESTGIYLTSSETGEGAYLSLDNVFQLTPILLGEKPPPDIPPPSGIIPRYEDTIPEKVSITMFREGTQFGFRTIAPIRINEEKTGVLISDIFYTQDVVEQSASLSKTDVNLFIDDQRSLGTLPAQESLSVDTLEQSVSCDTILDIGHTMAVSSLSLDGNDYYQGHCVVNDRQGNVVGTISVSLSQDIEKQEMKKLLTSVLVVSVLVSIFAIGFSLFASRKSVRFIQQLIHYIGRIAKGDIPKKIEGRYKGEFQEIQHNMNSLIEATNTITRIAENIANGYLIVDVKERSEKDTLMQALQMMVESLRDVTQIAEDIADGNLTIEVNMRSEKDRLMQALQTMVATLNSIVLKAKTTANHIATGSQQMSVTAEHVSQGSSQQAAAAEEASSSMEQMVANIRQNADNAKVTEAMALESSSDAQQGGEAVTETIEAMKKIEERISIIQEISMQTNILSMNATIEAAKAQDYGKGFAVVASEVRSLAGRSRIAAEEIEQLVKSCVAISEQAGTILERLVPNSKKTAELVQEINAASSEQHMGAEQINNAIQQLDQVIQQNAATADEMASSAEEFTTQVEQLREAMTFFTVKERVEELFSEEASDLMQTFQALLNTKGVDGEVLMAMMNTMVSSLKAMTSPPKDQADPASGSTRSNESSANSGIGETESKNLVELSEQEPQQVMDDGDDEFERF